MATSPGPQEGCYRGCYLTITKSHTQGDKSSLIPGAIKFHKRKYGQRSECQSSNSFKKSDLFFWDFPVFPGRAEKLNHFQGFGYIFFLVTKVQMEIKASK